MKDKLFVRYKMIYQGLKPEYFYWEFVNLLRKALIVILNVSFSTFSNMFKDMLCLLGLIAFLRLC